MTAGAPELDRGLLRDLFWFNASLGLWRFVKGIDYVRTLEFPIVAAEVLRTAPEGGAYLDIGSGDSVLPSFVATRSRLQVTALDKFEWVRAQERYIRRLQRSDWLAGGRFTVLQEDFLAESSLRESTFDVVTAVSVLEHIDGDGDAAAVRKAASLLKPGGRLLISVPYNHGRPEEYYVEGTVYGDEGGDRGAFFQRHYGGDTLRERLLEPASLEVERLFYCSHYDHPNMARRFYSVGWPWKAAKVFYNWATPFYAPRFMSFSDVPPSDPQPTMLAADTAFVFFRKGA